MTKPTREEALAMAREAGIYQIERFDTVSGVNQIEALVALVDARAYQRGVEDEKESCAALCDRFAERDMHPAECAADIRNRSKT